MSKEIARLRLLFERGKFKEAEVLARQELAKAPQDASLHLDLAQILCRLDRPKEAEEFARAAIALEPEDGVPHEVLAQVLLHSSNWKGAEDAVRAAMELDGDDPDRRAILARVAAERSKYELCLEQAEAGLAMNPDHDACRFFRGIALGRLGRHGEAEEASLGLLSDDPEDSTHHSARGWILLERHATTEARRHFQEALRLDPENEDARTGLARSIQQGNPLFGWLLRAIVAMDRIPTAKLLLWLVLAGVVLPRILQADGRPDILKIAGKTLSSAMMCFFAASLAVMPLFSSLLFASREGRMALADPERKAVRWSVVPMIAGFVLLLWWLIRGAKSTPVEALGLLCTATWIFRGLSTRNAWVRKRTLCIAGAVALLAAWLIAGPWWVMKPMLLELAGTLEELKKGDASAVAQAIKERVMEMVRVRNWAFVYPGLALYLVTAFAEQISEALHRRAPDAGD
jgi:Flp pilus assembly protein TadD